MPICRSSRKRLGPAGWVPGVCRAACRGAGRLRIAAGGSGSPPAAPRAVLRAGTPGRRRGWRGSSTPTLMVKGDERNPTRNHPTQQNRRGGLRTLPGVYGVYERLRSLPLGLGGGRVGDHCGPLGPSNRRRGGGAGKLNQLRMSGTDSQKKVG